MGKKIQTKNKKNTPTYSVSDFVVTDVTLNPGSKAVFLYRFVYSSLFSFTAVILIMFSFVLQGFNIAYASEDGGESSSSELQDNVTSLPNIDDNSIVETTPDSSSEMLFANNFDDTTDNASSEVVSNASEEVLVTHDENETPTTLGQETLINDSSIELNATMSNEDVSILDANEDATSTGDENVVVNETEDPSIESGSNDDEAGETEVISDNIASSTNLAEDSVIPEPEVNTDTVSVTESDSEFSFTKDECTQLATGSFYCLKPQANELKDALFSAPDEDGDLEIFFVKDGVQVQVTKNTSEDASPYYDQNTNSIVWHRLIDDRYQIVLYDVEKQTETVLTKNLSNNMEPTMQGDYIVWQRWVDGGWNIILYDGHEETQLTKTTGNNVAPYIHGSLVVWNRHNLEGKKTIEIYNIDSRTYVTVDDPDGLSVSNPRMVFVYDSLAPNGDKVTKGYDVLAKKFIELDTLPTELPEEIPTSDSTGETRALIQSKPSLKSEIEEITGGASSTPNGSGMVPATTTVASAAASTTSMTLDLSNASSSLATQIEGGAVVVGIAETDLAQFELVVEPFINTGTLLSSTTVQE